jgi:hypothetical protein
VLLSGLYCIMAAPARTQPPMKTLATLAETTSSLRIGSPHLSARLITVMINER